MNNLFITYYKQHTDTQAIACLGTNNNEIYQWYVHNGMRFKPHHAAMVMYHQWYGRKADDLFFEEIPDNLDVLIHVMDGRPTKKNNTTEYVFFLINTLSDLLAGDALVKYDDVWDQITTEGLLDQAHNLDRNALRAIKACSQRAARLKQHGSHQIQTVYDPVMKPGEMQYLYEAHTKPYFMREYKGHTGVNYKFR